MGKGLLVDVLGKRSYAVALKDISPSGYGAPPSVTFSRTAWLAIHLPGKYKLRRQSNDDHPSSEDKSDAEDAVLFRALWWKYHHLEDRHVLLLLEFACLKAEESKRARLRIMYNSKLTTSTSSTVTAVPVILHQKKSDSA